MEIRNCLLALLMLILLLVPVHAIDYGADFSSIIGAKRDGAELKYAVFWVGAWIDEYGWDAYEQTLEKAKRENVTPVIIWFYWGDQISPENVESENVYDPIHDVTKSKSRWYSMAHELSDITRKHMGDRPVIIVVEDEFNKNGIENYPKFNDYLIEHGRIFREDLNATLVVGFGNWYHQGWLNFRPTVESYDMVGFQMMRGSTRNSLREFSDVPAVIDSTTKFIETNFGKPSILYDLAISSYPEPEYEAVQMSVLESVLRRSGEYEDNGLRIIIYRELVDNKHMSEDEYFGKAERFWGLKRTDGSRKSSYDVFMQATSPRRVTTMSMPEVEQPEANHIPSASPSINPIENIMPSSTGIAKDDGKRFGLAKTVSLENTEMTYSDPSPISSHAEITRPLEFVYKLLRR